MELVDAVGHSTRGGTVLVALGHHVHDVRGRVDNGSTGDTDVVWNIAAADVRLQERRIELPLGNESAVLRVVHPYIVHVGRRDDHLASSVRCVSQWLRIPHLVLSSCSLPQDPETCAPNNIRVHVVIREVPGLRKVLIPC